MQGQITDKTWGSLMRLFDADGVSTTERLALARFVTELVDEKGSGELKMPKVGEVKDLLVEIRH
jgi:hypothetical protein